MASRHGGMHAIVLFQHCWIAPRNYNDHKGQINGLVLIQCRKGEHTDSDSVIML